MKFNIIVAYDTENGIGKNNSIPWHFSEDLKYFAKITKGNGNNAIIMGRKTFESINKRELPKRKNIIISKTIDNKELTIFNTPEKAITYCKENSFEEVWIIGGSAIYNEFLMSGVINYIYITEINGYHNCDCFFPNINPLGYKLIKTTNSETNKDIAYTIYGLNN